MVQSGFGVVALRALDLPVPHSNLHSNPTAAAHRDRIIATHTQAKKRNQEKSSLWAPGQLYGVDELDFFCM